MSKSCFFLSCQLIAGNLKSVHPNILRFGEKLSIFIDLRSCILHIQRCDPLFSNFVSSMFKIRSWIIQGFVHSWLPLMSLLFKWFIYIFKTSTQLFSLMKKFITTRSRKGKGISSRWSYRGQSSNLSLNERESKIWVARNKPLLHQYSSPVNHYLCFLATSHRWEPWNCKGEASWYAKE